MFTLFRKFYSYSDEIHVLHSNPITILSCYIFIYHIWKAIKSVITASAFYNTHTLGSKKCHCMRLQRVSHFKYSFSALIRFVSCSVLKRKSFHLTAFELWRRFSKGFSCKHLYITDAHEVKHLRYTWNMQLSSIKSWDHAYIIYTQSVSFLINSINCYGVIYLGQM